MMWRLGKQLWTLTEKFWIYTRTFGFQAALSRARAWWRLKQPGVSSQFLRPKEISVLLQKLSCRPSFSLLLSSEKAEENFLKKTVESVVKQVYPSWELLLITRDTIPAWLKNYQKYTSIRLVKADQASLAEGLNQAVALALGDYVALVEEGDLLHPEALLWSALVIDKYPEVDVIYTNEKRVSSTHSPKIFLKPPWSPDRLLGQMYIGRLCFIRRNLLLKSGGFRDKKGAEEWDLLLRVTERTSHVFHLPLVLYLRRKPESQPILVVRKNTIKEALKRRRKSALVEETKDGTFLISYSPKQVPRVSIVIPTKDNLKFLRPCLFSLKEKTKGVDYEIILVDNGSQLPETQTFLEKACHLFPKRFKILRLEIPFNFSRLVNAGVSAATGELILLLNDDTEVLGPETWLHEMAGYALQKHIGCVGAILLYPDRTIQHAGIVYVPGVTYRPFMHFGVGLPENHPGPNGEFQIVCNYPAVTGACLMVRRWLWKKVGGFDEKLAIFDNDVDFCLRLWRQGYHHVVLPHIRLLHHESKTRGLPRRPEERTFLRQEAELMRTRWQPWLTEYLDFPRSVFTMLKSNTISPES